MDWIQREDPWIKDFREGSLPNGKGSKFPLKNHASIGY